MANVPASIQSSVLAVLREVREAGVGKITRTTLFKLVYLLDCLHAETHQGQIASGAGWYFHSFGPFAVDLADGIDVLAGRGMVQSASGEFGDKEFSLYWLGEYPLGPALSEIGLSGGAASRFSTMVRKYAKDLGKLLDHVYFDTLPMKGATPGKRIDFSTLAEQATFQAHRHAHVTDQAKHFRLMELSDRLTKKFSAGLGNARALAAHRPIYDNAFAGAMAEMDDEDLIEGNIPFDARLA